MAPLAETGSVIPLQTPNLRSEFADFYELLQATEPTPIIIEITPALAREMLKRNKEHQRCRRVMKVIQFMGDMRAANWLLTGQGLSFDREGYLCDGQHRLLACINAKKPFRTLAVFGCDPKAFARVDTGRSRSPGDILHIAGVPNAVVAAAIIRWIHAYKAETITPGRTGAVASLSPEAILSYYTEHPDVRERIVEKITLVSNTRLTAPSLGVAFYTLFHRKNKAAAREFIGKVYGGADIFDKLDPAYAARTALLADRRKIRRLTQPQRAYILVRAWNAMRTNEFIQADELDWPRREPFPRIR